MSQQSHPQYVLSPSSPGTVDGPRFAYHRLMRRDPRYRWWRPLAMGSTTLGFYLALCVVVLVAILIMSLASPFAWMEFEAAPGMEVSEQLDMSDPGTFIIMMLSLIMLIPACFFAYLLLGPKPVGLLLSVTGRLRFKWLGITLLAALVIYVAYFGIILVLEATGAIAADPVPTESVPESPWLMVLLVLLLVPFQSAAEEYLFRGVLMQVIGSWLKHPLFAILLPIPLFVLGHLYDVYGQIDVAVFALAAGYLTWRTGGLEAAISLHVVNNVLLFLMGSAGLIDLNATESSLEALLSSIGLTALLTFVMVRLATRFKIERTAGPAPVPVPARHPMPWPGQGYAQQMPQGHLPEGAGYGAAGPSPAYYPPAPHPTGAYWAPPPRQASPAQEQGTPGSEAGEDRQDEPDDHRP